MTFELTPIAHFRSPFTTKFGIPKQSGLAENLHGEIIFEPNYRNPEAIRGLDAFDYLWIIWAFSANRHQAHRPTVRPPLLGGNTRMGVFATRSPYRPNLIGLSSVHLVGIDRESPHGPVLHVAGADLMDGTPIFDIKPYLPYADSHPAARSGFVDNNPIQRLTVCIPEGVARLFTPDQLNALRESLELDPRPHYQDNPDKVYGMPYAGYDVKFRVENDVCYVLRTEKS